MNIRQLNEVLNVILREDNESKNFVFIETGDGFLQIFEKGDEDYDGHLVSNQLFEIEYQYEHDEDVLCIDDCTTKTTVYYIDAEGNTSDIVKSDYRLFSYCYSAFF